MRVGRRLEGLATSVDEIGGLELANYAGSNRSGL